MDSLAGKEKFQSLNGLNGVIGGTLGWVWMACDCFGFGIAFNQNPNMRGWEV